MSNLPQEFSSFGCGDYRLPSAQVRTRDGFDAVDAKYVSHKIFRGKPQLAGLPASFAADDEAETLEVTLRDDVIGVEFILDYSVFEKLPVVARSVRAVNCGSAPVTVERLASLTLDYRSGTELDLVSFPGGWTRERRPVRERVNPGIREFGSNRGLSSHQSNPFFILCDTESTMPPRPERTVISKVHFSASPMMSGLDYWCRLDGTDTGILVYGGSDNYTPSGIHVRSWAAV